MLIRGYKAWVGVDRKKGLRVGVPLWGSKGVVHCGNLGSR